MTTPDSRRLTDDEAWVTLGEREIVVRRPTEAETFILLQVLEMIEGLDQASPDVADGILGAQLFGRTLHQLMVEADDRAWAYRSLLSGKLELSAYFDLAVSVFAAFNLEGEQEAPAKATKRAVAKVAARKASPRR